ncbi:hypothetical protein HJFPF1_09662 [Paramyrothecium foliicola]|nr:hypothetical protein HJFPF1_09662 [Paramyrothecium foliicola]
MTAATPAVNGPEDIELCGRAPGDNLSQADLLNVLNEAGRKFCQHLQLDGFEDMTIHQDMPHGSHWTFLFLDAQGEILPLHWQGGARGRLLSYPMHEAALRSMMIDDEMLQRLKRHKILTIKYSSVSEDESAINQAKLDGVKPVYLSECVSALSVYDYSANSGNRWKATILTDEGIYRDFDLEMDRLHTVLDEHGIRLPINEHRRPGEKAFQSILITLFLETEEGWNKSLDAIEELTGVTLNDFYDNKRIDELMFDRTMKRSRDYFSAFQILNLIEDWIRFNKKEVKNLYRLRQRATDAFEAEEFEPLREFIKLRSSILLKRVSRMKENITSLRDGLFNATSLQEATRGTSLNKTLYLFTTVTIIYLPISFLATLWALPWLHEQSNPNAEAVQPSSFWTTMIVVPGITYLLSAAFAWYFWPGSSNRRRVEMWILLKGIEFRNIS